MTQPVARAAPDTLDPAVYARAEALLGPNLVDQARNSFFTPHWLGDGELFWYRKELPNGHEDVVIDAATVTILPPLPRWRARVRISTPTVLGPLVTLTVDSRPCAGCCSSRWGRDRARFPQ